MHHGDKPRPAEKIASNLGGTECYARGRGVAMAAAAWIRSGLAAVSEEGEFGLVDEVDAIVNTCQYV